MEKLNTVHIFNCYLNCKQIYMKENCDSLKLAIILNRWLTILRT